MTRLRPAPWLFVPLSLVLLPFSIRPAAAQSMSSAHFQVTTQAAESGASPTSGTSNALSGPTFKTVFNVGRIADNLKTTASFKVREGYIPTLPTPPTPNFSITTTTLATAVQNASYLQTLQTSGGTPPVTWSLTFGTLPAGLSLNSSTGVISGVPTVKEVRTFVVKAADSAAHVASKLFTINVVSEGELVNPGLNTPYNISAHGFVAEGWQEFTWPGFDSPDFSRETATKLEGDSAQTLSRGSAPWRGGVFQQVPVTPGRPFTASIQAIMASIESGDGNVQIGIGLADGATTDPNQISASHFQWDHEIDLRVFNKFEATIVPAQGVVTVFLAAYNRFSFTTRVTFDAGAAGHDVSLKVATSNLPPAVAGLSYLQTLKATGGMAPYTWSLAAGSLPAGLSLSAAGTISGVPTTAGTQSPTLRVTDSSPTPGTAQKSFFLTVASPLQITSTSPLPRASLSRPYGKGLDYSGGNAPVTWTLVSGSLPPGLTLASFGFIQGAPTSLGSFSFTVRATDNTLAAAGGPQTQDKALTMDVGNIALTTGAPNRSRPDLVYNPTTNEYLLVYEEEAMAGSGNLDILAQRLDAKLIPIGSAVAVAATSVNEARPRLAYSPLSRRYAVVFEKGSQINIAILDDTAAVVFPSTQVSNSATTARQAVVAWRSGGGSDQFVIVWADNRSGNFRLFSEARAMNGSVVHEDAQIRATAGIDILTPAISHNSMDDVNMIVLSEGGNVRAFRTTGDAGSALAGSDLNIALKVNADNVAPDIVYESMMNRYYIAWQDGRNGAGNDDIFAIGLFADGSPVVSGEAPVTTASGVQSNPRVTYNPNTDSFITTWENQTESGDFDIYSRAQRMLLSEPMGPIRDISRPTADPLTETLNEFQPAIATNTKDNEAAIVWRDVRASTPQIAGETLRDFEVIFQVEGALQFDDAGFAHLQVDVFDPAIALDSLRLEFRINGRNFPFAQFGRVVSVRADRRVIAFDVPTRDLLGGSEWMIVTRAQSPYEDTSDSTDPVPGPPANDSGQIQCSGTNGRNITGDKDTLPVIFTPGRQGITSVATGATIDAQAHDRGAGRGFDWQSTMMYRASRPDAGGSASLTGNSWTQPYFGHVTRFIGNDGATFISLEDAAKSRLHTFRETVPGSGIFDPISPRGEGTFGRIKKNWDGTHTYLNTNGFRMTYRPFDGAASAGMLQSIEDESNDKATVLFDAGGRPEKVVDTLGRAILYEYHANGKLSKVTDWAGRTTFYCYDGLGNLRAVTGAPVTGTPTGNDFPKGKTTVYDYINVTDGAGRRFSLISKEWRPNEAGDEIYDGRPFAPFVADPFPVPSGPPTHQYVYQTFDPAAFDYLKVLSHTEGGTNASGVAAGGTRNYSYERMIPDAWNRFAVIRTTETDRNGNVTITDCDSRNLTVRVEEKTRGLRAAAGLPADPPSYVTTLSYDANGMPKEMVLPEGNKIVYAYDAANADPRRRGNLLSVERIPDSARGGDQASLKATFKYEPMFNQVREMTDARGNDPTFVPPLGGQSAARYTTTYLFDYQEGNNQQALADKLGMSVQEVTDKLAAAGVMMGLGDLNGDGVTNQVSGKVVKIVYPSVLLPADSSLPEGGGGTQSIVEIFAYNAFGQMVYQIDPEGNVTDYTYYPENDPDGDGILTPAPADGRPLSAVTGGYLKEVVRDSRAIAGAGIPVRRNTPGLFVAARSLYKYDPVGNVLQFTDGRGVRTDFVVNALNQTVRAVRAAAVNQFTPSPAEPETLTAFAYLADAFYDRNDNAVRVDVENRDGDAEPAGFITAHSLFDILDNVVETRREVNDSGGALDAVALTIDAGTPRQNSGFFLVTKYRYDANENTTLTILPAGNQFKNAYDERDLLMQSTRGFGATGASTFSYVYDKNLNLTQFIDGEDNDGGGNDKVLTTYDGFDRVKTVTDPVGDVAQRTYDPASNVTRAQSFGNLGGPSRTQNNTAGNVALGDRFFLHDELNRVFRGDAALFQNQSTVRAVSLTEGPLVPGDGRINARTDLDRSSRAVTVREDDLHAATLAYDGASRLIQRTDPAGNLTEFAYDDNSNTIEVKETDVASNISGIPAEVFLTTYFFDSLNRLVKSADNIGQTNRIGYDSRNNAKTTSDAQNVNSGGTITRRFFSGASVTVNAPGNTSSFTYDGLSRRLTTVMDLRVGGDGSGAIDTSNPSNPDGKITLTSTWDGNSRLKSRKDDNGNTTSYLYDALNRRTTESFADGTTNVFAFDRDDNMTSMTDENGSVRTYSFDAANRPTQCSVNRSIAFGTIGTTLQTWEYDGLHRVTRATDNNDPTLAADDSTVTLAYDSLSRLIEEVQSLNDGSPAKAVTTDWFSHGQPVGLTYPNNRKIAYAFENLHRPTDIRNFGAGAPLVTQSYLGGRLLVRNFAVNGTRLTYLDNAGTADIGYDAVRRVVKHRNLKNSDNSVIAEFEHSYNRANDRLFEKRLHDIDGFGRPKGETYGYDSLYRVVDFREGRLDTSNNVISGTETETQNWTLDGVGNWATTVQDGVTKNQTVTSLNEYSFFGGVANAFDENGDYVDDGQFLYKWDFLNRLREVRLKSSGALLAVYAYDAGGRRIRRETTASANVGAGVERYFYDGAQCIEERTGADLVKRQYVVGGLDDWLILDRDTNGDGIVDTSNFYHTNALGSVAALTDLAGNVVERYTYSAYGRPLFENPNNTPATSQVQSALGNPHLFAGYRYDPEAGLSFVRARYLHHGQGRWLSRDPIPGDNLYRYVADSPMNGVDPYGLAECVTRGTRPVIPTVAERLGPTRVPPPWRGHTWVVEWVVDWEVLYNPSLTEAQVEYLEANPEQVYWSPIMAVRGRPTLEGVLHLTPTEGKPYVSQMMTGAEYLGEVFYGWSTESLKGAAYTIGLGWLSRGIGWVAGVEGAEAEAAALAERQLAARAKWRAMEAGAESEAAALRPYGGPGGGHHVPAKSAFEGAAGYDPAAAPAIPNAELARLGVRHGVITGAQQTLYRAFAATGEKLTWETVETIETQALIRGGMEASAARATVKQAIGTLQGAGVTGPTRIPWGG